MPLSCATHQVAIFDRGGYTRLGMVTPLTSVHWERRRDDMSMARCVVTYPTWECQQLLKDVRSNRHELVVYRDGERVWEGCISRIAFTSTTVTIEARDILYYLHRTAMRAAHSNAYPNVTTVVQRVASIVQSEVARKEALGYNILSHLRTYIGTDPARTARTTPAMFSSVLDEMEALATRSGLDYTTVGRSILLFDRQAAFYTTPRVSEKDFLGEVIVTEYGMEGGTRAYVTDGQGRWGATSPSTPDPYYGEWEIVDTVYQEGDDAMEVPVTEMESQARRNLSGRNPVPVVVRVPDGSRLNPNGALSMKDLVCGARVPLVATLVARGRIEMMQKLDAVTVTESGDEGESITVTMSPASAQDTPPED